VEHRLRESGIEMAWESNWEREGSVRNQSRDQTKVKSPQIWRPVVDFTVVVSEEGRSRRREGKQVHRLPEHGLHVQGEGGLED
jgi:hypothetical protein